MTPVEVVPGTRPVVLAFPHSGTFLPPEVMARLNARGQVLSDTDWHLGRLYDGLLPGASIVRATFHRYVIDANRPPDGASLYPGQNTTGLVPLTDFDGEPIWIEEPDAAEIAARRAIWHTPYHRALREELNRVRQTHGLAVLYDCHSIRSRIPFLFEGVLPDFNIGTVDGCACAPEIGAMVQNICETVAGYRTILNGRFKGGWTTRTYGCPDEGFHAVQMELAQVTHLETEAPPYAYDAQKSARLREVLRRVLGSLADWAADARV